MTTITHTDPAGWKAYRLHGIPTSPVRTWGPRVTWTPKNGDAA